MSKKHRRIGLLVSGILDQFTESLCRGAVEVCKKENIDLIIYPGKYLDRDLSQNKEIMYEYQYNTIFDYAASSGLDGLVVSAGSIGCFSGDERVRRMLESFGDIPCILVASKWDGYTSIGFDNESGIREGLEYLLDNHTERFAILAGPEGNTDAKERKQAFLSTLAEHGIEVEDKMIVYGDLNRENREACEKLLDDNPDVQAIFCVNDDMALGLYDVMFERGLVPGRDIMVFGYDNTVSGAKARPSLSTVGSDAVYLGQKAIEAMCRIFEGKTVGEEILPVSFIKRDSFGKQDDKKDVYYKDDDTVSANLFFDEIFYRYLSADTKVEKKLRSLFESIVDGIFAYANGSLDDSVVLRKKLIKDVDEFLDQRALDFVDMDNLVEHIERIYEIACEKKGDMEHRFRLREMIDIVYRRFISSMDHKSGRVRFERQNEIYSMKMFVRDSLSFRKGNDASFAAMLECIDWLDIKNAYLYMTEEPVPHLYGESFVKPDTLYLKAYLKEGKVYSVPVNKQKIPIDRIIGNSYFKEERNEYILIPVFYNETYYGILVCDLTDKLYANGEFLASQLGAAVHMIDLLHENERIQEKLGEVVHSLSENNIVLDHLSKQDPLTGIYNRRGYLEAASGLIAQNKASCRDTLIAYVDMNNLKVINDRYGHEEGDYSLTTISRVLGEFVGDRGIIGRIGGDEYSFAMTVEEDTDIASVERGIHALFLSHNGKSDKKYNVTVSVGMYRVDFDSEVCLEDALSYADERLYAAKLNKVRVVEKQYS